MTTLTPFSKSLSREGFVPENIPLESILKSYRASVPRATRLSKEAPHAWTPDEECEYLRCFVAGVYEPPLVLIQQSCPDLVLVADGQNRLNVLSSFVQGRLPWIDDEGNEWYYAMPTQRNTWDPVRLLTESERNAFLQKHVNFVSIGANDATKVENFLHFFRFEHTLIPSFNWPEGDTWSERITNWLIACPGLYDFLARTGMNAVRNTETFLISLLMTVKALRSDQENSGKLLLTLQDCQQAVEDIRDLQPIEKARLLRIVKRLAKVAPKLLSDAHFRTSEASDEVYLHPIEVIATVSLVAFTMDLPEQEVVTAHTAMVFEVKQKIDHLRLDERTWACYRYSFPTNSPKKSEEQPAASTESLSANVVSHALAVIDPSAGEQPSPNKNGPPLGPAPGPSPISLTRGSSPMDLTGDNDDDIIADGTIASGKAMGVTHAIVDVNDSAGTTAWKAGVSGNVSQPDQNQHGAFTPGRTPAATSANVVTPSISSGSKSQTDSYRAAQDHNTGKRDPQGDSGDSNHKIVISKQVLPVQAAQPSNTIVNTQSGTSSKHNKNSPSRIKVKNNKPIQSKQCISQNLLSPSVGNGQVTDAAPQSRQSLADRILERHRRREAAEASKSAVNMLADRENVPTPISTHVSSATKGKDVTSSKPAVLHQESKLPGNHSMVTPEQSAASVKGDMASTLPAKRSGIKRKEMDIDPHHAGRPEKRGGKWRGKSQGEKSIMDEWISD